MLLGSNLKFSRWTFFKHLPTRKFKLATLCQHKSVATLSHFGTLTPRQKNQIHLYVDTLLQWNKVFNFSHSYTTQFTLSLNKCTSQLRFQRMNLTAVREVNDVMERHVEDSLAILPALSDCYRSHCGSSCDKLSLVDVGTGAGLPGVVLAIARPGLFLCHVLNIWIVSLVSGVRRDIWFNGIEWDVTLMESMNKRCVFLEHVVGVIGSSNVQIVRGRAEVKYTPVLL